MLPTTFYGNQKQPLIKTNLWFFPIGLFYQSLVKAFVSAKECEYKRLSSPLIPMMHCWLWICLTGALYGLVESPKDWAVYRDAQLKRMKWKTDDGKEFRVCPTAEAHLWEVRETKSKVVMAYLGIYVDDIMVVGEKGVMDQVMQDLKKIFYMSPYEEVTDEHEVTFCGFEIAKTEKGYSLHQSKYIGDFYFGPW